MPGRQARPERVIEGALKVGSDHRRYSVTRRARRARRQRSSTRCRPAPASRRLRCAIAAKLKPLQTAHAPIEAAHDHRPSPLDLALRAHRLADGGAGPRYKLEVFPREASGAAPPPMKAIHSIGKAPIIRDGDTVLAESGAIVEYIVQRHGGGRLAVAPGVPRTRATSTGCTSPRAASCRSC